MLTRTTPPPQVLELLELHAAGLVHSDIKPANIILAPELLRFLLVDLGAAVDLRSGTTYKPDEALLDPAFCRPEQVRLHRLHGLHMDHLASTPSMVPCLGITGGLRGQFT